MIISERIFKILKEKNMSLCRTELNNVKIKDFILNDNLPTTLSPAAIVLNQRDVSPKGLGKKTCPVLEASAISKVEKECSE